MENLNNKSHYHKKVSTKLQQKDKSDPFTIKAFNHSDNRNITFICYTTYNKPIRTDSILLFKTLSLYLQQFQLSKSLEAGRTY